MIDREALVDEAMWRGAFRERPRAEAACAAALDALARHLGASDRAAIAAQLPAPFAARVLAPTPSAAVRPDDLYAQLSTSEGVSLGLAVEHARAVCSSLGSVLDAEARSLLARRLPPDWAALFAPVAIAAEGAIPPGTLPGHGHTLATGRPGSRHTLAEAAPRTAQADSVVNADNPHDDSKLSSATEPASTTGLATARPGAEDPIADARDERPAR